MVTQSKQQIIFEQHVCYCTLVHAFIHVWIRVMRLSQSLDDHNMFTGLLCLVSVNWRAALCLKAWVMNDDKESEMLALLSQKSSSLVCWDWLTSDHFDSDLPLPGIHWQGETELWLRRCMDIYTKISHDFYIAVAAKCAITELSMIKMSTEKSTFHLVLIYILSDAVNGIWHEYIQYMATYII